MTTPRASAVPAIAVDRRSGKPLYRQVYDGYRAAIIERRLRAGDRIPSTRGLADELGISRIPVLNAFEQLLAEGYLETRVGAGTFVASSLPVESLRSPTKGTERSSNARPESRVLARAPELLLRKEAEPWRQGPGSGAFCMGAPAADRFPIATMSRLLARHGRRLNTRMLRYGARLGYRPLREAIASYLRTARAMRCEADQIMVVSGSQQAIDLCARVLLDPGDHVWIEEPGYDGARDVLAMAGVRLVPVPVDDEGVNVAAGVARCAQARAAFVTPTHQYPLGASMSASRRLQLLEWAESQGAWILEDDYDSEYRYESQPVAALQGMDRSERVLYIGTFSKVLFPSLRLGYIVIPEDLIRRFSVVRAAMDISPPTFMQVVLTEFIDGGHFALHIRRMRQEYRERRGILVESLGKEFGGTLDILGDQAGLHLVAAFPKGFRDREIAVQAALQELWVTPLSTAYIGRAVRQGLVLGYGNTTPSEIRAGVRKLRDVVRDVMGAPRAQGRT